MGCTNATFLASFNNEDPGVQSLAQGLFRIDQQAITSTFGISSNNVNFIRNAIPPNPAPGFDSECLIRCGSTRSDSGIVWQPQNWAFGCDFPGNDITRFVTTGEQCGRSCLANSRCNHFTWNPEINGGTCFLKQLSTVTRDTAIRIEDQNVVCGLIIR